MGGASLLLLPLIGGYALATIWDGSLYNASRESGHRLYFRALFYAVIVFICAGLIHIISFATSPKYHELLSFIATVTHGPETLEIWDKTARYSVFTMSFTLGPILGHTLNFSRLPFLLNRKVPWTEFQPFLWWQAYLLKNAIQNNDFERIVYRSFRKQLPLLITLQSGKIYIGWAVRAPNPVSVRKFLRILPLISGYRNSEHRLEITTDYYTVLETVSEGKQLDHLEIGDFEVVIPIDQIISAHLFDLLAHKTFLDQTDKLEKSSP